MKHLSVMFLLSVMSLSSFATAGDPDAGKARSASCAGCHGTRNNPMMSGMAKGLSDADIANIASYYTNLKQD